MIITSDYNESQPLKKLLEEASFAVDLTADFGTRPRSWEHEYNLILLDIEHQKREAIHACIAIRSAGEQAPIIALTESKEVEDRVALLNAGADDCMSKPYQGYELVARIRAIMRRGPNLQPEVFRAGTIVFNTRSQQVLSGKRPIPLSRKEFAILELLFRNRGDLVSRSLIIEQVWSANVKLASNTVGAHFHNIRKKLGRNARNLIKNIPGRGYFIE